MAEHIPPAYRNNYRMNRYDEVKNKLEIIENE